MTNRQRVMILAGIARPDGCTNEYYSDACPSGEYTRVFRMDNGSTIRYQVDESGAVHRRVRGKK